MKRHWSTGGATVGMLALCAIAPTVAAQDSSSARQDTSVSQRTDTTNSAVQNPPGYRGMERPAGTDSAAAQTGDTGRQAWSGKRAASTKRHSMKSARHKGATKWCYPVDSTSKNQNPAGYRGMERPANVVPDSGARSDSSTPADATSRINQRARQDSTGQPGQNPPGYRGMERPATLDSTAAGKQSDSTSVDTTSRGDSTRTGQR
jgi:hypothetical protein